MDKKCVPLHTTKPKPMSIYWILFLVALVISSVGWKKFIYFISIGYGFSIAGCAVAIAVKYWNLLTAPTILLCAILFLYGCRLGGYLLLRELKSASYRKVLLESTQDSNYPFFVTLIIWLACAFLYMAEVCPITARLDNTASELPVNDLWAWIGAGMMVLGIIVESVADAQKSAAKKVNPHRFVNTGLYRMVRCPNYFGEVIMWTGCLLVCIGASCTWWQWLISALGYVCIVYIMFSGARRLELRQNANYGNDPEYQAYVKKTPILIPLLPIYSVARYGWLRG